MAKTKLDTEAIVHRYFEMIRDLRNGKEESVDALMDLWDDKGTFEFAGAFSGAFKGALAIRTLYHNRLRANGASFTLETKNRSVDVTLGTVDTQIAKIRKDGNRALVGWRTVVATGEKHGFDVPGSHVFTFKGGKIAKLRVSVSSKPMQSELLKGLSMASLTTASLGHLSQMAWAVV
jgi:hypothetical protein